MKEVASTNQLAYQKDVKHLTTGRVDDFKQYVKTNPNMTWYAVVWCTTEWDVVGNITIPCTYSTPQYADKRMMFYSIFYNNSLEDSMFISGFHKPTPRDPVMIQLKNSIDNAILKYLSVESGIPAS